MTLRGEGGVVSGCGDGICDFIDKKSNKTCFLARFVVFLGHILGYLVVLLSFEVFAGRSADERGGWGGPRSGGGEVELWVGKSGIGVRGGVRRAV